jgi:hypothetical protein
MATTTTYKGIRPDLKTGDVLLFKGTATESIFIELVTEFPYSHSGLVVEFNGQLCIWDATSTPSQAFQCQICQKTHYGARLALLDPVIEYYTSYCSYIFSLRQIQPALGADALSAINVFLSQADSLPFPSTEMMTANYASGQGGASLYLGKFFCSELVATTLMRAGALDLAYPPNSYAPGHFSEQYDLEELRDGFSLAPQYTVEVAAAAGA